MSTISHSNVYIIRIVDVDENREERTWFMGPYGSTRAEQQAIYLEHVGRDARELLERACYVEALWSDDECLRVDDYNRTTMGSLR